MYQALYRKYRPQNFESVAGQTAIVKTLKNSLQSNKINHAYLFYGPRGTGKTTLAKLYAKSINCLNLKNGEPCENCEHCLAINQKECVDIVEIDAASNNGVDEIRELKNKINLVPSLLRYKVYIIDEVHMLSIGAFNALLKTLEEPPEHVVFILATTEIHKVPATIVSRCQCFCFQKIDIDDVVNRLSTVVEKEKIQIEPEVLREIAYSCDGGMRDALGILDQLSSYTNTKITLDDYHNNKGTLSLTEIDLFLKNIFQGEIHNIIKEIQMFDKNGRNFVQIINQFIQYLHNMLTKYYVNNESLPTNESQVSQLIFWLNSLQENMKNTENPKIIFEVSIIEFIQQHIKNISREINREKPYSEEESLKREEVLKKEISSGEKTQQMPEAPVKMVETKRNEKLTEIRINNTFAHASKQHLMELKDKLPALREYIFDSEFGFLICMILDGTVRAASDENVIVSYEYESMVEKAWNHEQELEKQILERLKMKVNLVFITDEKWEELKREFISKKEQNISYEYIEEPEENDLPEENLPIENKKNETSDALQQAVDLFGDIVEIEK